MRRLALTGGAVLVAGTFLWSFFPAPPESTSPREELPLSLAPTAAISPVPPTPAASPQGDVGTPSRRTYAIGLHELVGLSPDAVPGTEFELWVTWEPPVTRSARIQLLVKDARLERLVPPVVPEGPTTALLSLPTRDVPDLLYGDRFGHLSAVTES